MIKDRDERQRRGIFITFKNVHINAYPDLSPLIIHFQTAKTSQVKIHLFIGTPYITEYKPYADYKPFNRSPSMSDLF